MFDKLQFVVKRREVRIVFLFSMSLERNAHRLEDLVKDSFSFFTATER
jgi:hypothetical protein